MEAVISIRALSVLNEILGSQPRDKAAMLNDNTIDFFFEKFTRNRVKFPVERNAFVGVIQRGRHDITWKLAI